MKADRGSATAKLIAAATVMREVRAEAEARGPAGAAAWCERFLCTSRGDRLLLWSARSRFARAWWRIVESVCVPGVVSHWMRRKREIDRLARQAAAEGFTQLIVLGAGLDALAFRLGAEGLYERVLSADHPATLAIVRSALPDQGGGRGSRSEQLAPGGVELIPLDLAKDDACGSLAESRAFDRGRATLVVIEGVLMYFPEPGVMRVLESFARLPAPNVRLIASFMHAEAGETIGFRGQSRLVAAWLSRRREPMLWASTPAALTAMLSRTGWGDGCIIELSEKGDAGSVDGVGLWSEQLLVAERRTMDKRETAS